MLKLNRLLWHVERKAYIDLQTGIEVPIPSQNWVYFAVQMAGGLRDAAQALQVPESRVVAWIKQNKVDIRFVRVLSLLSRVPQYLLRSPEALQIENL